MPPPPPPTTPTTSPTAPRFRFLFRARVIGNLEWICPSCGHFNRSHLRPLLYTVQCSGVACRRAYGLGHSLHELPMARRSVPDDYTIPRGLAEAMPEGDAGKWWRSGKLMHCLHTATGELAVPDAASGVAGEAVLAPRVPQMPKRRRRRKRQS